LVIQDDSTVIILY